MAVSAAEYYEVRWRVKGNDEAWSSPRRVAPVSEVVIEELERNSNIQYEIEVRAVSNCGAKSIWVPSDYTVPGAVPPTSVDTLTAQPLADGVHLGWTSIATPAAGIESSIERSADGTTGWAERARVRSTAYTDPETSGATYYYRVRYVNFAGQFGAYSPIVSSNGVNVGSIGTNASNALADAAAAQADADAANAALADIASDGILSPVEKPVVIRDYNVITTEQPGIDAQATAYAITTQKTAYDSAFSALTSYLGTLTAPVLWSDLTGNTTIVGATFRSKFADVYTTRQALLNAIYAAAKAKADAAQDTANTAVGQVTQLPVINGGFDIAPVGYGWTADAGTGWGIDTAGNTPGVGPNSAHHAGGTGNGAYRNNGLAACGAGQVYKAQGLIKAVGATGVCYVFISWCNAAGGEIGSTAGNFVTGTTTAGSYAVGTAPAGTVYARTCLAVASHTAGHYYVDNVLCSQYPSSQDEVPDGSTYSRGVQQSANGSALAIDNANFQLALDNAGNIPGWVNDTAAQFYLVSAPAAPYYGSQYAVVQGPGRAVSSKKYAVKPGDIISIGGALMSFSAVTIYLQALFYNASGTLLSGLNATTTSGSWTEVSNSFAVPSGAAYMRIGLYAGTTSVYAGFNYVWCTVNDVRVAGSGARLGDMRNQVMVGVGNYGAGWSGGSITYSASSTSATITAAAATLQLGSSSLAYNSANTTVSGSAGLVRTYYLYYDDDGYTGGSKTLNATTSQLTSLSANGRILVGQVTVTFPTSGTGGGGGSTGCPDENAWVLRADPDGVFGDVPVQAKTILAGHYLRLTDGRSGLVTYSKRKDSARVRVTDENGETLTCSTSAPLELAGTTGECVLAPKAAGRQIKALSGGVAFDPLVWKVEDAGDGYVQHITCQNACFWTGDAPGYLFGHHNLKPP